VVSISFAMKNQFTLAFIAILVSCGKSDPKNQNNHDEWDKSNATEIRPDDPGLIHSKKLTEENLPYFISEFSKKHNQEFYVKLKISESGQDEHIWLKILDIDGGNSYGTIENDPAYFKQIKYGDTLKINIYEAEDIIINRNDSIIFGSFLQQEINK